MPECLKVVDTRRAFPFPTGFQLDHAGSHDTLLIDRTGQENMKKPAGGEPGGPKVNMRASF